MTNLITFILAATLLYSFAGWAGTCGQLNCDCAGIPNQPLRDRCYAHEQKLQKSCKSADMDVKGYCGMHGPRAFPVAVTMRIDKVSASEDVKSSERQIDQLYWSIRQDQGFANNALSSADYKSASAVLRISKTNVDSLLKAQSAVAFAWTDKQKHKKAIKAWRAFSKDSLELAEFWRAYLNEVNESLKENQGNLEYFKFREALAHVVGLMYEQTGYAFSRAEKYKDAAQAWKVASEISATLVASSTKDQLSQPEFDFYRNQTASRLNRASLHWLFGNREDDEDLEAAQAIEYASDKSIQDIIATSED